LPQPEIAAKPPNMTSNAARARIALRRRNGIRHSRQANTAPPIAAPWLFSARTAGCAVLETVATAVAFPSAATETLAGDREHTGSLAEPPPVTEQDSATLPTKPLTEVIVTESVTLAPVLRERAVTAGVIVKLEGAETTSASAAEVEPLKVPSPEYTAVI